MAAARAWQRFIRFAGVALAVAVVLALLGYGPTVRFGGREAIGAMLVGCGISLAGSLAGMVLIVLAGLPGGPKPQTAIFGAMLLRLVVVAVVCTAIALSGWFPLTPLLLWTALSYVVLLAADTACAVWGLRPPEP